MEDYIRNLLKQVSELSINERQCVAIVCFERYCRKHLISHPDISAFVEHVWKVAQIKDNFCEWSDKFVELAITGQGDPYPDDLRKAIPPELISEFNLFTQYVYEIGAVCWYGSESDKSNKMLLKIFEILDKHSISFPDLCLYRDDSEKSNDGWTPAISDDKLNMWRASV